MTRSLFSTSTSISLLVLACSALVACVESPQPESAGAGPEDSTTAVTPPADSTQAVDTAQAIPADPVARWTSRLPEGALVRSGACPFECCVYRKWEAESDIALLAEPRVGASGVGRLEAGSSFQADSGFVRITQVALVAVTETVTPMPDRSLEPGDTLLLLDYIGEGFYNAWLDGEIVDVADFWSSATDRPRGEVIGERETEWWVHATTADGTQGWFRADAPGVELGGVDACA